MSKSIPTHSFNKSIQHELRFEFQLLEKSYSGYNSEHPHRHNYYEIVFFNESGGNHEIDFLNYLIKKNSFHFISPGQIHLLNRQNHVTGYVLSFTHDFFINQKPNFLDSFQFLEPIVLNKVIEIKQENLNPFLQLFQQIENEFLSSNIDKQTMIEVLLYQLLLHLKRYEHNHLDESKSNNYVASFKKLVKSNYKSNLTVNQYAELLHISASHLNDLVKKNTGKSAKTILLEYKLLEAKRLLYFSNKSVKEIAFELQFQDQAYFNRFFKRMTQQTPFIYRNEIRKKYN